MCFGGKGGGDGGAEEMRRQEAERQARVAASRAAVGQSFAGFDDPFYENMAKSYTDYYMPDFERQRTEARNKIALSAGNTASSAYQKRLADFERDAEMKRVDIQNEGRRSAMDQRGKVEQARSNLLAQAESGAGAESIASQGAEQARLFSMPQAYSPLADLFSRFTAIGANNAIAGAAQGGATTQRPLLYNSGAGTSSNSVRVVR